MNDSNRVSDYIDFLQSQGRYTFARDEIETKLDKSSQAIDSALRRLKDKGRVVSPKNGFYVIIPLEYRSLGSLPASWFVDELMDFLEQPYYISLLSAAELHGSAHQRPQIFQVMTDRPTRPVDSGKVRIEFHTNRLIEYVPVRQLSTRAGYLTVSTPEATAVDLVRYYRASGGLDNVATVLTELAESIDPEALAAAAALVEEPIAQRLGYLLDSVGHEQLTVPLHRLVSARRSRRTPLRPDLEWEGVESERRWNVVLNAEIESDI